MNVYISKAPHYKLNSDVCPGCVSELKAYEGYANVLFSEVSNAFKMTSNVTFCSTGGDSKGYSQTCDSCLL